VHRAQALKLLPFLQAWPTAAFLLDADGRVHAHSAGEQVLRGWLPEQAMGLEFFREVLLGGQVPELGGAFHAAMDDDEMTLDLAIDWQLGEPGRGRDVTVRLRKVSLEGTTWCLAIISDLTRVKTAERALAAVFGEARDQGMIDPETGLFGRRQFDFVLPIELRRATRYGYGTAVLAMEVGTLPVHAREPSASDRMALRVADRPMEAETLRIAADHLAKITRQTDVLFHFEPTRFHVVLTHTDQAGAQLASQRLGASLRDAGLFLPERRVVARMAVVGFGPDTRPGDYQQFCQLVLADLDDRLRQLF
jgi:GGDEF domain-containing protein